MRYLNLISVLFFLFSGTAQSKSGPTISPDQAVLVVYVNPSWNKESTKIEAGSIVLRDRTTNRVVQLSLQETDPDSGRFSGLYAVSVAGKELSAEIYVLPDGSDKKGSIQQMIASGSAQRKPYIVTRDERGLQLLEVYQSKDLAEKALKNYNDSIKPDAKKVAEKAAVKSVLDAEQLAALNLEKKKLALESRKREQERKTLEDSERKKLEALSKENDALDQKQKEARAREARAYAEAALDFFRVNNFKLAEEKFAKAVSLDPTNRTYYYKYAISLFKNEKFNESLVYLRMCDGKDFDPVERDFYLGLNHFRLKEYPQALIVFKKVEESKDPQLAASGAFYQGIVKFTEAHYEEAKIDFERVLDVSTDPQLDQRAEEYLEKIDALLQFAKNKAKKFTIGANFGPQYDSNVLLASDNQADQGNASELGSSRLLYGGSFAYRPIFEQTHEFALKAKTDYTYTTEDRLARYDTWTLNGTAPFTLKTTLFDKGFKLDLVPGYERLYLGQDAGGNPKETMNSFLTDLLNTLILQENWFTSLNIKYRQDVFKDTPDSNATKIAVSTSNSFFFNKAKTQALVADLGYTTNASKGDASKYNRTDLSAIYLFPLPWELQALAGVSTYSLNYEKTTPQRKDSNLTATAGLTKPLYDWLKSSFNFAYISNESNVTANKYKKYTVGLNLAAEYQF